MATSTREIVAIPVDQIDATNRLRPVNLEAAAALAALIRDQGQLEPVWVYDLRFGRGWKLIAGAHRLQAMKLLGRETIDAMVFTLGDDDSLEMEIAENLHRTNLHPIDRARFVATWLEMVKGRRAAEADAGAEGHTKQKASKKALQNEAVARVQNLDSVLGIGEQAAAALGMSRSAVYLDFQLHRNLSEEAAAALRQMPDGDNASLLLAFAKLGEDGQSKVLAAIRSGRSGTLKEALNGLKPKALPRSREDEALIKVVDLMGRAGAAGRGKIFDQLLAQFTREAEAAFARLAARKGRG